MLPIIYTYFLSTNGGNLRKILFTDIFILISFLLSLITFASVKAELPYETDTDQSIIFTYGKQWNDIDYNTSANVFTCNYLINNFLTFGLSYHQLPKEPPGVYAGNIQWKNTTGSGSRGNNTDATSFTNLFALIKPFNLFKVAPPVSISILGAYQKESRNKTYILMGYISKIFNLSEKNRIQPILSFGYKDVSSSSQVRRSTIGEAVIFSHSFNEKTDLLIIPRLNHNLYWYDNWTSFSIQIGIAINFIK